MKKPEYPYRDDGSEGYLLTLPYKDTFIVDDDRIDTNLYDKYHRKEYIEYNGKEEYNEIKKRIKESKLLSLFEKDLTLQDIIDFADKEKLDYKNITIHLNVYTGDMSQDVEFKIYHRKQLSKKEQAENKAESKRRDKEWGDRYSQYLKDMEAYKEFEQKQKDEEQFETLRKKLNK